MELTCAVQTYAWGKRGSDSKVAQLVEAGSHGADIDPEKTYAELWMGTHPSGPSVIRFTKEPLSSYVERNPSSLGAAVKHLFGSIPFLFKVLSVRQPLSIQAHPTKEHAKQLHRERPDLYPDANHKPEIAIALTHFRALCGFRPYEEIVSFATGVPELAAVLGEAALQQLIQGLEKQDGRPAALKAGFTALMTSSTHQMWLSKLVERLSTGGDQTGLGATEKDLILELHGWYPGDIGCLAAFFLNQVLLVPGQAIYLPPNVPHAYLKGDCVECMACSDNVVRAGLTPKHIDVPTLCDMLSYHCQPPAPFLPILDPTDPHLVLYNPPIKDFAVYGISVLNKMDRYEGPHLESGSILLVVSGVGRIANVNVSKGSVLFLPCGTLVNILNIPEEGLQAYLACCVGNVM